MKPLALFALVAAATIALTVTGSSQAPAAPVKNPVQALQAIKQQNQQLLEKQAAALQKLDDIQKEAQQLRIFARRT